MSQDTRRSNVAQIFQGKILFVIAMLLLFLQPSVGVGATVFIITNIADAVTSSSYGDYYGYEGMVVWDPYSGPLCDAYDEAVQDCDSSSPSYERRYGNQAWGSAYTSAGLIPFFEVWAFRMDKSTHLAVDLRGITTNQYVSAYLAWELHKGDSQVKNRPVPLDHLTVIDEPLWEPPWMECSDPQLSTNWSMTTPAVWVVSQVCEVASEDIRPDGETCEINDPVNAINGNVSVDETDIFVPCPGPSLTFARSYCSVLDYSGPLGHRWTHSYNWLLLSTNSVFRGETNSWRILQTGDGRRFSFQENESGVFSSPIENGWRLSFTNSTYEAALPGGRKYTFSSNGVLQEISDSWLNTLQCSYTNDFPSNLLTRVEHSNGQSLDFSYQDAKLAEVVFPSTNFYIHYAYNGSNELTNVVRTTSEGAFTTSYAYDTSGNHSVVERVNALGELTEWGYVTNALGQVQSKGNRSIVASNYFETTFEYMTNGLNGTVVTMARGDTNQVYEYYYHPVLDRALEIRGPSPAGVDWSSKGVGVIYGRDDTGNITNEVVYDNALGESLVTRREFDVCHNVTNTSFGYGASSGNEWSYTWDTNFMVMTSVTDPEGHKAEFEYNNGLVKREKIFYSSNSYDTAYSFTTNGLLASVTNANGHWISYSYDQYGRLKTVDPQLGPTVTFSNNVLGFVETVTVPGASGNRVTTLDSDELGRVRQITYPNSTYETFSFDAIGNLTNHVDTMGRDTRYTYKPAGRLSSVIRELAGGSALTNSFDYDGLFNSLRIKDAKGRDVESYVLDIQDRPVTVTNVEGQVMSVNYGVAEYVKWVERFDGTVVSNEYDSSGRLYRIGYPGQTNTFSYLDNGLLKTAANLIGAVTNSYNAANRLTSSDGVGPTGRVAYAYYPAGQVSNVLSVAGSVTYRYDAAERVERIERSDSGAIEYEYAASNGLASAVSLTNSGISAEFGYDVMDRLASIVWEDASNSVLRSFAYSYNAAGMITGLVSEAGETIEYEYDDLDRLTRERHAAPGGATLSDESYTYDEVGNRTSKTRGAMTVNYTYPYGSSGNRLSSWHASTTNGWTACLDVVGHSSETIGTNGALGQLWVSNMTERVPGVSGTNFWVYSMPVGQGTQQIVAAIGDVAGNVGYATNTVVTTVITNGNYAYNVAGCVTGITYNGAACSETLGLGWDSQYRLMEVKTNGATAEAYRYDALGRRVQVINGSTTNHLVYDAIHVIAEVDSAGTLQKSYTWGPGRGRSVMQSLRSRMRSPFSLRRNRRSRRWNPWAVPPRSGVDDILAMTVYGASETNTYYFIKDHLNSVHAVVDESGEIVESYRYDAWGRVLGVYDGDGTPLSESAIGNHYLWQGRWYSWDAGIYYFRARWYDPTTGRWLSKDPIGISGGANQYSFCANSPVNWRDPFGLCPGDDPDTNIPPFDITIPPEDIPDWGDPWFPTNTPPFDTRPIHEQWLGDINTNNPNLDGPDSRFRDFLNTAANPLSFGPGHPDWTYTFTNGSSGGGTSSP